MDRSATFLHPLKGRLLGSRFGLWAVLALAALALVAGPLPQPLAAPGERHVRVEAGNYAFSPGVIHANPGDRVTIELVSKDVVHGLYLEGYDLGITADPGQTATLSFTADKPGSFRFRCSVTCGALHPFMIGQLKVGRNTLLWRGVALGVLALLAGVLLAARPSTNRRIG